MKNLLLILFITAGSVFSKTTFAQAVCPSDLNAAGGTNNTEQVEVFDLATDTLITIITCNLLNNGANGEPMVCDLTPFGNNVYFVWETCTGSSANCVDCFFDASGINVPPSVLPIELVYFEASTPENGLVQLKWTTLSELNNDFFTIEKTLNGKDWSVVANIKGSGNSNEVRHYQAFDNRPFSGLSYYRLKQTDFDGKFTYSPISSVRVDKVDTIDVYPNPTNHKITVAGDALELAKINVTNSFGKQLQTLSFEAHNGSTEVEIDLSELPSGIYFIHTATQVKKVIKK
jgi:hypothetical protein